MDKMAESLDKELLIQHQFLFQKKYAVWQNAGNMLLFYIDGNIIISGDFCNTYSAVFFKHILTHILITYLKVP